MPTQFTDQRRLGLLVLIASLHVLFAWLLMGTLRRPSGGPVSKATYLVLLRPSLPQPAPPAPARRPSAKISTDLAQPLPSRPQAVTPGAPSLSASPMDAEQSPSAASSPLAAAAGLDSSATGRALREASQSSSLAYRARERDGKAPATLGQRLESGVKSAGRRDCLNASVNPGSRGDSTLKYAPIPVTGLLVAPFLVADALTGKCGL